MQVVLLKSLLRLFSYVVIWVLLWLIQHVHFDIEQELVMFGEYRNDGDCEVMC